MLAFNAMLRDLINLEPEDACKELHQDRPSPLKERSSLPHFETFQSEDSNGILWFELQRELESIYYQRIDFVDAACARLSHKLAPWSFAVFVVYQSLGLGRHPETGIWL